MKTSELLAESQFLKHYLLGNGFFLERSSATAGDKVVLYKVKRIMHDDPQFAGFGGEIARAMINTTASKSGELTEWSWLPNYSADDFTKWLKRSDGVNMDVFKDWCIEQLKKAGLYEAD